MKNDTLKSVWPVGLFRFLNSFLSAPIFQLHIIICVVLFMTTKNRLAKTTDVFLQLVRKRW